MTKSGSPLGGSNQSITEQATGDIEGNRDKQVHEVRSGYAFLFRNSEFMCLWIAQIFCQLGDRAVFVLFVALLTAQQAGAARPMPGGAAELTSWLYVAFTIPAIVLSPLAGVYVDRWSKKSVLILSNVLRGGFVALVALPYVVNSPKLTYALAFFISIGAQFFGPAETSTIPRIVKREDLYCANSLFFTTMMIALGFGFAVGEPIISHFGLERAHWAVAGSFIVAALLLLRISNDKPVPRESEPWWEELRFGLAYIADNPLVFRAIIKITVLFSTIIALNIIAVGFCQQVLRIQPFQFGWMVAAAGIGMGLGNFWVAHWGARIRPTILIYSGFSGLGMFLGLLGCLGFISQGLLPALGLEELSWHGWLMSVPLILTACAGFACAMVAVPTQAALQAAVPEQLRGKVFAAQNTAMSAASTVPAILVGQSAEALPGGVCTTLIIIGLPMLAIGSYHLRRSALRRRCSSDLEIE